MIATRTATLQHPYLIVITSPPTHSTPSSNMHFQSKRQLYSEEDFELESDTPQADLVESYSAYFGDASVAPKKGNSTNIFTPSPKSGLLHRYVFFTPTLIFSASFPRSAICADRCSACGDVPPVRAPRDPLDLERHCHDRDRRGSRAEDDGHGWIGPVQELKQGTVCESYAVCYPVLRGARPCEEQGCVAVLYPNLTLNPPPPKGCPPCWKKCWNPPPCANGFCCCCCCAESFGSSPLSNRSLSSAKASADDMEREYDRTRFGKDLVRLVDGLHCRL